MEGGKKIQLLNRDIEDWKITFVDTGLTSNIGQRFKAVEKYLEGEEVFLANYSDGLTDLALPEMIENFYQQDKIASFLCVKPSHSFHLVSMQENGVVNNIQDVKSAGVRINGGYFIFKQEIFQYIKSGEELVCEPFQRLINQEQLLAYKYDGFWGCMDTFKEQQQLDDMYSQGNAPWAVWNLPVREAKSRKTYRIYNNDLPLVLGA